ncbi:MBL fold metallo-hydrolase [Leifsonia sp. NPDC058230]|uniref:MBL fold metallo-hydrolase n=1 Tax=Leifsonia sp. NPDC058230 TaxID=3346391 RepID=UPI0036DEFC9E
MAESRELSPGIRVVPMPMRGDGLPYSLSYLIDDDRGGVHIVDPGSSTDENWATLASALRAMGRGTESVAQVIVTHLHADHLGLAERVRAASGAAVVLHERERDAPIVPDVLVADGDILDIPGRAVQVVHTPGHTPGSICLAVHDARLLFTGDHVLPTVNPGLGLGGPTETNPIADYLASLERIAAFDDYEVGPGHEYVFRGLAARCSALREHHLKRSREVAAALAADPGMSVPSIASRLTWTDGWENLDGFRLDSALAQTAMHRAFVASEAAGRYLGR